MITRRSITHALPLAGFALIALATPGPAWADPLYLRQAFFAPSTQSYATDHFVLLHEGDSAWPGEMGRLLEGLYRQFYDDLTGAGFDLQSPGDRLAWVCFDREADFDDYARLRDAFDARWLKGYYSTRTNCVALVRAEFAQTGSPEGSDAADAGEPQFDVRRISHELAHQLTYNSGLLRRGVRNPVWLTEGLATDFEADSLVGAGFSDVNRSRWSRLLEIAALDELVPLPRFIALTEFRPAPGVELRDLYAQADGFFHFLMERHPQALKAYMAGLARGAQGARAREAFPGEFAQSFGPLDAIGTEWRDYLRDAQRR
ncbi:MAG: DUF1570 domain-containing protein [bacterium]|nr:DUF1570 domain-containing protein [bacterium]